LIRVREEQAEKRNLAGDRATLEAGLRAFGLRPEPEAVARLLGHARLVREWSRAYNLVARGDLDALVRRHVLDSLAIHELVAPGRLLDVGSGAGFPGLPLAIVLPGLEATLIDSSGKRARFLGHVVRVLGLERVRVVQARVEEFAADRPCNTVVSRAFSSLSAFAHKVRHLCDADTRVLALKGQQPDAELEALPGWVTIESVRRYDVPDLHAERHVVIMALSPETA
jgi:16S rRNA (guanine527-N7)-methyltransferase